MDEKELEELATLEREALEERDSDGEDNGTNEDSETGTEDEKEDDIENSGDGHENEHSDSKEDVESEVNEETDYTVEGKEDFTPIEIEVGGHKVKIESKEDLMAYVQKGAESFNKSDDKFKDEKLILEQAKLTADDLKLFIDAKNGSKEAIAKLAEMAKVDVLDLDADMAKQYKNQFEPYIQSDVDKVAGEILADTEHASQFRNISTTLPKDFMNAISSNAEALKNFSGHIKSGLAQEVIPLAITAQMRYGGSFMEHYVDIGQKISQKKTEVKPTRTMSEEEVSMRQRASQKNGSNTEPKKNDSAEDIWDMSDKEFAEKYGR